MHSSAACLARLVLWSLTIEASFGISLPGFLSTRWATSCTSRVHSNSVASSASRCESAWKVPTGRPNYSRELR